MKNTLWIISIIAISISSTYGMGKWALENRVDNLFLGY